MCLKSSATDGVHPITRASSPPSGRARSRLSRIMLLRSQESSRASSRLWSRVLDIITSVRCHHKRDGVCDSATYKSEHQAEEPLERLRRENPRSRNAREVGPCAFLSTFALYSPWVQEHNRGQSAPA